MASKSIIRKSIDFLYKKQNKNNYLKINKFFYKKWKKVLILNRKYLIIMNVWHAEMCEVAETPG